MPEFPFPSYGYYEALRDRLDNCTYAQLKERLVKAERAWTQVGMIEHYAHQLFRMQAITVAQLREAIRSFDSLCYGQVRELVTNLERTPYHHVP